MFVRHQHITIVACAAWTVLTAQAGSRPLHASEGPAYRVKDLDTTVRPYNLVVDGDTLYFLGSSTAGPTLWRRNGDAGSSVLVKQLPPAYRFGAYSLVNANGQLFFGMERKLWTSDGTDAGTVELTELASLPIAVDGTAYFIGVDRSGATARLNLFRSDGTVTGTKAVTAFATAFPLAGAGHLLFLVGDDGSNGMELWRSDGTASGTFMLKDINPNGHALRSSNAVTAVGDEIFFFADDGSGFDLWRSDGTETGTTKVEDLNVTSIPEIAASDGTAFFCLDRTLWRSDGTDAGTEPVATLDVESCNATRYVDANGILMLFIQHNGELRVWASDGTGTGTMQLHQFANAEYGSSAPAGSGEVRVLFTVRDTSTGSKQLWRSDGTTGGTELVKALVRAEPYYSRFGSSGELVATDDRWFLAAEGLIWQSDGTQAGTTVLDAELLPNIGSGPAELLVVNGTLFFAAAGSLWASDGTAAGTQPFFPTIDEATGIATVTNLTAAVDGMFFQTSRVDGTDELWHSDGTVAGTSLLGNPARSGYFTDLTAVGRNLFFAVFASPAGQSGLWSSDGTVAGTLSIKTGLWVFDRIAVADRLFFAGYDFVGESPTEYTEYGDEPWLSDGTPDGTALIKDINPGPAGSLYEHGGFARLGAEAIFVANDGVSGFELWKSDGTEAGTEQIVDLHPGPGSPFIAEFGSDVLPRFTAVGDAVLFLAKQQTGGIGRTLWRTDGTAAGTDVLVPAINESALADSVIIDGTLYFTARDGSELWKSDGTAAGTERVLVLALQQMRDLSAVGNILLFRTESGIWRSDGTGAGTMQLQGGLTGYGRLVQSGSTVFFAADDGVVGSELWALPRTALDALPCVADCNLDGAVRVDELVTAVRIALGATDVLASCSIADLDSSGVVTVNELVTAVNYALRGCQH